VAPEYNKRAFPAATGVFLKLLGRLAYGSSPVLVTLSNGAGAIRYQPLI